MSCATCPYLVTGILAQECDDTLSQVRRIKRLTQIFNTLLSQAEQGLIDELHRLIDLIPNPPFLDLSLIGKLLTCPLTPNALVTELFSDAVSQAEKKVSDEEAASGTTYDPITRWGRQISAIQTYSVREGIQATTLYRGVEWTLRDAVRRVKSVIARIQKLVDAFIDNSAYGELLQTVRSYIRELERIANGAAIFAMRLVMTTTNAQSVRTLCPELYNDGTLPYRQFVQEMTTFSFNGVLPSGMNGYAQDAAVLMAQLQTKLSMWAALGSSIPVAFI